MSNPADISVVMSVYNNADTLPAALDSILSQEGVDLEFIVINDGSTDASGKILDEAASRDSRLKVIHKQNEGLTRALIDGCALASAPWIARQDADDISLPGRLRTQLDRAFQPDSPVLIGCAVRVCTPAKELMMEIHPPENPVAAKKRILEEGQAISSHGSILFKRDAYQEVGGYRAPFYYAQDIDLTTRLAESGPVTAVDSILYEYQFSASAISGRHGRFQRAFYDLIRKRCEAQHLRRPEEELLRQAEDIRQQCLSARGGRESAFEAFYFMGTCLLNSMPARACRYFLKAWAARPWAMKSAVRFMQAAVRSRGGQR